jgi:hypothetical protein
MNNNNEQLRDRLNRVLPRLQSADLLNNKGLGNEIGFYIFDYPPEHELEVDAFLKEVIIPSLDKYQFLFEHDTSIYFNLF